MERVLETNVRKDYVIRLKCPSGDEDKWVLLRHREETLEQILNTPWDFECPLHGVLREIPVEASEATRAFVPKPERSVPVKPREVKAAWRLGERLSLHVPVLVCGRGRDRSSFREETSSLLVNGGGGLIALAAKAELGDTVFVVNKTSQEGQECRIAFIGPELEGKFRVGVAFKNPAPGFWRVSRREHRMAKALHVRVQGVDRNGNHFVQSAHTIDVSQTGARLDGVGYLTGRGETVEVRRRWQKAAFRVVWVGQAGTTQANQIGICSLEPGKDIWGVPLPQPKAAKAGPAATLALPSPWGGEQAPHQSAEKRPGRPRLPLDRRIAVVVRWVAHDGPRQEQTTALLINEHACMVPVKAAMIEGMALELVHPSSERVLKGRVAWCGTVDADGCHRIAIELEETAQFWDPA